MQSLEQLQLYLEEDAAQPLVVGYFDEQVCVYVCVVCMCVYVLGCL